MSKRKKLDAYMSPTWAAEVLLRHIPLVEGATVVEPCAGDFDLVYPLLAAGANVLTADIDPAHSPDIVGDATDGAFWEASLGRPDWTITNPPFSKAHEIVQHAFANSKVGIAMLLRLSYLEPVIDRADFLAVFPPTKLIVLPRFSFTRDGKTDSVTCAWMVWMHDESALRTSVVVVPREAIA